MRRFMLPALASLLLISATPSTTGSITVTSEGRGVLRGDLGPARGSLEALAEAALDRFSERLGAGEATFALDSVRRSIIGTHLRGREIRGGVPVEATSAAVHVIDGRIVQVEARASSLAGQPVFTPITGQLAVARALEQLGVAAPTHQPTAERLLVRHEGRLVDAWRVFVFSLSPAVAAEIDVAAADGRVLAVRDPRQTYDGLASVFDPNAVVALKDSSVRTPGVDEAGVDTDLDSAQLTSALTMLPVRQFDEKLLPAGKLVGPWVNVQGPAPLDIDGVFGYTRGDPRFETTMAYTHIDRFQRYMQAMGFTGEAGVNAEPQDVYTLPIVGFDNSFYMGGGQDLMAFGAGGVDDGEDAEVILHEYGHAIHDAQVPGWGDAHEGGAMGEGWGDFLAGAYYARISGGFQDACIMDWDATSYSSANPPCLRRMDTGKIYPKDMRNQVHADGEIWSGFLWNLRSRLGCTDDDLSPECQSPRPPESHILSDRVLKLVLASHELLTTTARFGDAVAALITAADALGHPEWVPHIQASAAKYGLPLP